jgi:hypothetical protein
MAPGWASYRCSTRASEFARWTSLRVRNICPSGRIDGSVFHALNCSGDQANCSFSARCGAVGMVRVPTGM